MEIMHEIENIKSQIERKYNVNLTLNRELKDKLVFEGVKNECF